MSKKSLRLNHAFYWASRLADFRLMGFLLLCASSFILQPSSFASDVPAAVNCQGTLVDPNGNAVTAGVYRVAFRIWDDATGTGTVHLVWGREFTAQVMTGGLFNVLLTDSGGTAATNPMPQTDNLLQAFQEENRYLGLTITEIPLGPVGSPEEIDPRQQLASAPFVFQAQGASDAEQATGGFRVSNGLVVASGGIEVAGDATLHDTLAVEGTATFNHNLTVDHNLEATNQSMEVNGLHVFSGGTQFDGSLTVAGNVAVDPPAKFSGFGTVPVGAIILWSGAAAEIPDGWALCDGRTHSGHSTPDMRARFVAGAGRDYSHGDTDGEAFHTLTIAEMPSHHHSYDYRSENKGYWGLAEKSDGYWKNTKDENTDPAGGDQPHENRPLYYALCYIMRVK